jgi:small subunit ribosomal protein S5
VADEQYKDQKDQTRHQGKRKHHSSEEKKDETFSESKSSEWKERVIQIRRVTKVVKGGKKLSFRAVVVVGNGQGQVGIGVGKSSEVIGAIQKAIIEGRKSLITVPIFKKTIPHPISARAGAGKILLRPAAEGTGIIAGGCARSVLELAGIENVLCKSLGSDSSLNIGRATIAALSGLRRFKDVAQARGLTLQQMFN